MVEKVICDKMRILRTLRRVRKMREMRCSQKVEFLKNAKLEGFQGLPVVLVGPNLSIGLSEIRCLVAQINGLV